MPLDRIEEHMLDSNFTQKVNDNSNKIGVLSGLQTIEKGSIVGALNEAVEQLSHIALLEPSGGDDSIQINTMISEGKKVKLSSGTFLLNSPITHPTLLVNIEGEGVNKTILKATSIFNSMIFKDTTYVNGSSFKNFTLDCNYLANHGLEFQAGKQFEIERVSVKNSLQEGCVFGGTTELFYEVQINKLSYEFAPNSEQNNFDLRPDYGIRFLPSASDNHINDVVVKNVKVAGVYDESLHNQYDKVHVYGYPYTYSPQYGFKTNGRVNIVHLFSDGHSKAAIQINGDIVNLINPIIYNPPDTLKTDTYCYEFGSGVSKINIVNPSHEGVDFNKIYNFVGTMGSNINVTNAIGVDPYLFGSLIYRQHPNSSSLQLGLNGTSTSDTHFRMLKDGKDSFRITNKGNRDLQIGRYDSNGTYVDNSIYIANSTGDINMNATVKLTGTWQKPLYLNGWALWVTTAGKLMTKNSAPTSETDGTVVGTQA